MDGVSMSMENATPNGHGVEQQPSARERESQYGAANGKPGLGHKRSLSGSILSKLSFLRASADENQVPTEYNAPGQEFTPGDDVSLPKKSGRAMAVAVQQQRTRRRKGSLRKAALLGRGAQKREMRALPLDTNQIQSQNHEQDQGPILGLSPSQSQSQSPISYDGSDCAIESTSPEEQVIGLGIDHTPRPSMEGYASHANNTLLPPITTLPMGNRDSNIATSSTATTSPTLTYTSTTDEEELLPLSHHDPNHRDQPLSSGSESYFPSLTRRRSAKTTNSPLGIGGIATTPLPVHDAEWDYSETEWWGWVILICTWIVFVVGMGSCLGVWSWAWDVGETPYAPPELEDDPTLPIVGYYPALIILTAVMAWVWVVVAWVGMKYFRHAKISGD